MPRASLKTWIMAARPATLPAAVVPVLVGSAVALRAGSFRPLPFLAALLCSVLIQIGTNLANDYFDHRKGADTAARMGPTRVTQSGLIAPETVLRATGLTFGLAGLIGVYLVFVGGWPILLIGALSILCGVLYTGGPYPLGYHGLGDLFCFVFFGVVAVTGTAYLHLGAFTAAAAFWSLPVALLVTAIIVVNNVRDTPTDALSGKRTLTVIFGERFGRAEYALEVILAYGLLPLGWALGYAGPWALLPLLTLPVALPLLRAMRAESGPALNRTLKGTGQLHMLFGALLAVGLVL